MLGHLLWVLAITWLLGSLVTVLISRHFIEKALDRALLDDARTLAAYVSLDNEDPNRRLVFNLPATDLEAILFVADKRSIYAVIDANGRRVAGHREAMLLAPADVSEFRFDNMLVQNIPLRRVTLKRDLLVSFTVVVAQTVDHRSDLLSQLLLYCLLPQALFLALASWWMHRSLGRELDPLVKLQRSMSERGSRDLRPLGLQASSQDLALLSQAFDALLARIDAAQLALREFAGNVSHEVRTPLAGIRSLAQLALARSENQTLAASSITGALTATPLALKGELSAIVERSETASHLIDQLLALALAEEMNADNLNELLDLDDLVQRSLVARLAQAQSLGVDLGASGLEQRHSVRGHRVLLEGLLGNLIDNAFRYGRPTQLGRAPKVTVELSRHEAWVCMAVVDNGPGMSDLERAGAMQRWSQGAAGKQVGLGSGLGLAIVGRYVKVLGGQWQLMNDSSHGGLRVQVNLPAAIEPPTSMPS